MLYLSAFTGVEENVNKKQTDFKRQDTPISYDIEGKFFLSHKMKTTSGNFQQTFYSENQLIPCKSSFPTKMLFTNEFLFSFPCLIVLEISATTPTAMFGLGTF